jgi:hypothetical protein
LLFAGEEISDECVAMRLNLLQIATQSRGPGATAQTATPLRWLSEIETPAGLLVIKTSGAPEGAGNISISLSAPGSGGTFR